MDTCCWVALIVEKIVQCITAFLGFHKDEGQGIHACNNQSNCLEVCSFKETVLMEYD